MLRLQVLIFLIALPASAKSPPQPVKVCGVYDFKGYMSGDNAQPMLATVLNHESTPVDVALSGQDDRVTLAALGFGKRDAVLRIRIDEQTSPRSFKGTLQKISLAVPIGLNTGLSKVVPKLIKTDKSCKP